MTKGRRIRLRREELNISQTDFAKLVNVSKQTLYKYENDIVTNIPSDKIQEIADALDVTPAYLMGWEDDDHNPTVYGHLINAYAENEKKKELFAIYESLSPEKQASLEAYIKFLQSQP